jgi:hypothetical protein
VKPRSTAVALAIAVAMAAPALALPALDRSADLPALALPVLLGDFSGTATLTPYDPRAPALAAERPAVASGLYTGEIAETGGLVRLILNPAWDPALALGLVQVGHDLRWVTVRDGAIVPAPERENAEAHGLIDNEAPADASPAVDLPVEPSAGVDGKLQILLDGDYEFGQALGLRWDEYQLAQIALVSAIYEANLGIPIEVVQQHVHTTSSAIPDQIKCEFHSGDGLIQFRDHWESRSPTTRDAREAAHLFSQKARYPHYSGSGFLLGCAYLFYSLPQTTQLYFLAAHLLGLAIYLLYGARRSTAGDEARPA